MSPRVKLLKPRLTLRPCPVCKLKGGLIYCRRCHGPRKAAKR